MSADFYHHNSHHFDSADGSISAQSLVAMPCLQELSVSLADAKSAVENCVYLKWQENEKECKVGSILTKKTILNPYLEVCMLIKIFNFKLTCSEI